MMNLIEELNALGVDTAEALDRVMGDEDLYEMMLGMFITSINDNPVSPEDLTEPVLTRQSSGSTC